jgi:SpoVK/Ycf46/Vps4 family AAA+-type ATPase
MEINYFNYKVLDYTCRVITKHPKLILHGSTVVNWHSFLNDEELLQIISDIKLTFDLDGLYKDKLIDFSGSEKRALETIAGINTDFLDINDAEQFLSELKLLPASVLKELNNIIIGRISIKMKLVTIEYNESLQEIKKLFQLNDSEIGLLTLYYCLELYDSLSNLVRQSSDCYNITHPDKSRKFISELTDIPFSKISHYLNKNSKLVKLGIIDSGRHYGINDEFTEYLSGFSTGYLIDKYAKQVDTKESLMLDSHLIPKDKIETLKMILNSPGPCSILLHGRPGTGKTELTSSLAKEIGIDLFAINIMDEDGEDDRNKRKRSLFAVQNHPKISESLIIVDECDQLINSKINFLFSYNKGSDQKAWLNEYLDINKCKMIWITNTITNIDESTFRRFNYILEFADISNLQREKILKTIVNKNEATFLNDDDIKVFSKKEKLTSGHYSIALKTVNQIDTTDEKKKEYFNHILNEHQSSLGHKPLRLKKISQNYCIEGLNIDQPPTQVIEQSRKILSLIDTSDSDLNLNTLLYGPPGTGKTEFVKYLGQELGKEIILKRASDLLSMWVGGSEKNIRIAFEEAEREKKILFIDEADSLLSSRDGHNRTWETTQVNEILTCMENFRGVLICATNHVEHLDMAAQRRFLFKLKFDYLKDCGVKHFYNKFFGTFVNDSLEEFQIKELETIKGLTPSDFNNLKRKFEIIAPKNNNEIIEQLKLEVGYKNSLFKKKIGMG